MNIRLDDFFDKTFFITIDESRKKRFEKIFRKCFSFNGYGFPHAFWGYFNDDLKPTYKCALSHASIIKLAKAMDFPFVVIFEDDAYPCKYVEKELKKILHDVPDDADMLVLGYNKLKSLIRVNDRISKLSGFLWGSHAYVIFNKAYTDYLIRYNKNPQLVADDYFGTMRNVYVVNSNLFIQSNESKSMNGYVGYIYDNVGHERPPSNFDTIDELTSHVDSDSKLLSSIKDLGRFIYRENGGNAGDFVIAASEFDYFDNNGFDYELVTSKNKSKLTSQKFNLVYGGGGGWVSYYHDYYQKPLNDFFRNKNLEKCVILPSTFYKCDDVIDSFDERFIVFCRDRKSYEYCISRNKVALFYMHDDMALSMDVQKILNRPYANSSYDRVKKTISSVSNILDCGHIDELSMIRTDVERTISVKNNNIDLSNVFGAYGEDVSKTECMDAAAVFVNAINKADKITTNRLHVMIVAHLLGKNIVAYDNSYGKLSAVYDMSLKSDSNIVMNV